MTFNAHILRPLVESVALVRTTCTTGTRCRWSNRERFLIFTVCSSSPYKTTRTRKGQQQIFFSSSCNVGCGDNTSTSHPHGSKEWQNASREEILKEAAAMSRSLYRLCFRSARYIQKGNDHDEQEFQEREEKRLDTPRLKKGDNRLGMLSMLPPVDREDELHSRSEYYLQYMRENFVAELDCLAANNDVLFDDRHVARYLFHLRKGNDHRKWLLHDMKFEDPYSDSFDTKRVDRFEERATTFFKELEQLENGHAKLDTADELNVDQDDILSDLDNDDDSSDDDDNDVRPRSKNRNRR